jgi:hypothetical protein
MRNHWAVVCFVAVGACASHADTSEPDTTTSANLAGGPNQSCNGLVDRVVNLAGKCQPGLTPSTDDQGVCTCVAQCSVSGQVRDATGAPLVGLSVEINYLPSISAQVTVLGTGTDDNGHFSLDQVPCGKLPLEVYKGDEQLSIQMLDAHGDFALPANDVWLQIPGIDFSMNPKLDLVADINFDNFSNLQFGYGLSCITSDYSIVANGRCLLDEASDDQQYTFKCDHGQYDVIGLGEQTCPEDAGH